MKGYKAFGSGMICRGKQYAENTVFEEDEAIVCEKGMHFCKEPLDVLNYYPLVDNNGNITEFAEVEALDDCVTEDNKKFCTKKLKVLSKLSFANLVNISVKFEKDTKIKTTKKDNAQIGSSGDCAQIGSSGHSAKIGSSGDYAQIGSSGDCAQIGSSGDSAVICCAGHGSIVKAKKGSWITLSEWKYEEKEKRSIPICVKTEKVDGEKIKEDTYYKLENGEFVEVSE